MRQGSSLVGVTVHSKARKDQNRALKCSFCLAKDTFLQHYNAMYCTIQIFINNEWQPIAQFEPFTGREDLGFADCGGYLEHEDSVEQAESH